MPHFATNANQKCVNMHTIKICQQREKGKVVGGANCNAVKVSSH
jgi:hypothetical protein